MQETKRFHQTKDLDISLPKSQRNTDPIRTYKHNVSRNGTSAIICTS